MGVDRRNRELLVKGVRVLAEIDARMPAASRSLVESAEFIADPSTATAEDVAEAFNLLLVGLKAPAAPVNLTLPAVTGTLNPTETLTTTEGTWISQSAVTDTESAWQSSDSDEGPWAVVDGEGETTIVVPAEDSLGLYYRSAVTITTALGSTTEYSEPVGPIVEA